VRVSVHNQQAAPVVIDALTLALTHGLMAIAALILASRPDLDDDGAAGGKAAPRWKRGRQAVDEGAEG
jgi:hypothetical protein